MSFFELIISEAFSIQSYAEWTSAKRKFLNYLSQLNLLELNYNKD